MLKVPVHIKAFRVFLQLIVLLMIIVCLYPLVWMIMTSFKTYNESITWPPSIFPKKFLLSNYVIVFSTPGFIRFFLNSIIYSVGGMFLTVLTAAMAGYAFAKFNFKGKHFLFLLVLSTMMVPGQVTLIPTFLILKSFHWLDTFMGLIIPGVASGFGIFLIRQFAMGIPNDFIEAPRVDGASETRIFVQIFLPLIMPALSTLMVLEFMGRWNDLFWPLIVLTSTEMRTVQLSLTSLFRTLYDTRWSELSAAMTISAIPVFVLYLAFQKYFTQGIVLTSGIKG